MATLADSGLSSFYSGNQNPQSWGVAGVNLSDTQATAAAGEDQRRLLRNFTQYDLPSLVSRYAARGSFYSGGAQGGLSRAKEQVNEANADINTRLQNLLSGNALQRTAITTGGNF